MPLQHSQSPSVEWELAIAAGVHYLESLISSDKGAHKDTKAHLTNARSAFSIWKSKIRL